jgi:prophage regulatory protein
MSLERVQSKPRFTSVQQASADTGLSRTTMWRMARQGTFPRAIAISPGRVAYITAELEQWIAARIEEREPGRRPNLESGNQHA